MPHDHQSAVLPGIQNFFLDLHTVSYFHIAPRVLPNPTGPLLSELSPSAIVEANAAVNCVQKAKTKEIKKREIDLAKDRVHCTHV